MPDTAYCPSLPSSDSMARLVLGDASALPLVLRDLAGRSLLAAGSAYVILGGRYSLLEYAQIGAAVGLGIEALVGAYTVVRVAQHHAGQLPAGRIP